ncbi:MAG: enoyl-CoA hydratase/isomerase family protein [Lachnospiraceae bacterium]|nr:enoyl-CoA hydratase/isomerase family protein [Lachnospiraceae bacterium]
MPDTTVIKYEKKDNIGIITLDNPKKFNSITAEFYKDLIAIEDEIAGDPELRAVILTASGKHFCAGYDLSYLNSATPAAVKTESRRYLRTYNFFQDIPIPVIAAVDGVCYGSGVEIILACDLRIVAETARIAIVEAKYGLAPDLGGTTRLTKLVGPGQAKRMIMGCDEIDGKEARSIGLAEIVVPREELMETAMKYAKRMASFPPNGIRFSKFGINVAMESSEAAGFMYENAQGIYCCGTNDLKEATLAFLEKRQGVYTGD